MASPIAILAALALAFIAAAAFALWIIGSPSRSHPACRACGADARGRIWATPVACAQCNAPLDAPGAIRALGRQRSRLLLIVTACAMTLAVAILLTDRRIASVGMRWDATFIPAARDIEILRTAPGDAEDAIDRLWLRAIRGRLSPGDASETVDVLLASSGAFAPGRRSVPDWWILLNVAGLRASHIADPARYFDAWQVPGRHFAEPATPLRPGERVAFKVPESVQRSPWAQYRLLRAITVDGRPLELEGGCALSEGRFIPRRERFTARIPAEMPEGDYEAEILFEELLVPMEARQVLAHVEEGASIDALGVKLMRCERSVRRPFSVRIDAEPPKPSGLPHFSQPVDMTSWMPTQPLLVERFPPRTLLFMTVVTATLLPIGLFIGCCLRRFLRGRALLVTPRCAGCRSELHADARQCTECGGHLDAPFAVRALRFRTSLPRILLGVPLTAALGCGLAFAFVRGVPLLDRWSGDVSPWDDDSDRLEADLIRLARHQLDDATAERIAGLLSNMASDPTPDWPRITALLPRLLVKLERSSHQAVRGAVHDSLESLRTRAPDEVRALLDSYVQRATQPLALRPLRHRAEAWSSVNPDPRSVFGKSHKLHEIEGVPWRPMVFGHSRAQTGGEILVPATPGPFEVSLVARPRDHDTGPTLSAVAQLESIAAGQPLATVTIDPLLSPFLMPPTLTLHQIDDRTSKGRWIATIDRESTLYVSLEATPFGRWIVEPMYGSGSIDIDGDVDLDRLGAPGTPVILRFEPLPLEEFDPDKPVLLWGVPETWRVLPELRPLGHWKGEPLTFDTAMSPSSYRKP